MITQRISDARLALDESLEVRDEAGLDYKEPLCVYDLCSKLGINVRFVNDISMEGIYLPLKQPVVILSSLRPLPRRVYNCAHEIGHHRFGHSATIDELQSGRDRTGRTPEEFLADTFAGFLLIPSLGVTRAFNVRGWDPKTATAEQMFTVACSFGVGYTTIVNHLAYGLKMVSHNRAQTLKKIRLPEIRASLLANTTNMSLTVADRYYVMPTIDAESGMLVLLPKGATSESSLLEHVGDVPNGRVFKALGPGLIRVEVRNSNWAFIVRISRLQCKGLAKFRHFEEVDCE